MTLKSFLKDLKKSEQTINTILGALVVIIIGVLIFNYLHSRAGNNPQTNINVSEEQQGNQLSKNLPQVHQVKTGERLWNIAIEYYGSGYNWVDIAKANNLSNPNVITVDQKLVIPAVAPKTLTTANTTTIQSSAQITGNNYTVLKGDNLWKIAVRAYGDGYKWVEIAKTNKLVHPGVIHPGNVLTLPR